jgi:glucan 1,3-beta-glucosidase
LGLRVRRVLFADMAHSGAVEMVSDTDSGTIVYAAENTQATIHPFWSILAAYSDDSSTESSSCDDDDTSPECMTAPVCDYTQVFRSFQSLANYPGPMPQECVEYNVLVVLQYMLDQALTDYATANDGYDGVFGDYVSIFF